MLIIKDGYDAPSAGKDQGNTPDNDWVAAPNAKLLTWIDLRHFEEFLTIAI